MYVPPFINIVDHFNNNDHHWLVSRHQGYVFGLRCIRIIKIHFGSRLFCTPIQVQPALDYSGSSKFGPGPGKSAIPKL